MRDGQADDGPAISGSTTHVCATAQSRLDLPVTIGALRDLHFLAIGQAEVVVLKRCVSVAAGCVDGHVASVTSVGSDWVSTGVQPVVGNQWSENRCANLAQNGTEP